MTSTDGDNIWIGAGISLISGDVSSFAQADLGGVDLTDLGSRSRYIDVDIGKERRRLQRRLTRIKALCSSVHTPIGYEEYSDDAIYLYPKSFSEGFRAMPLGLLNLAAPLTRVS